MLLCRLWQVGKAVNRAVSADRKGSVEKELSTMPQGTGGHHCLGQACLVCAGSLFTSGPYEEIGSVTVL